MVARSATSFGTALIILLMCWTALAAAKEFVPPRTFHAKTYPARDEHANEKVTIAADPYDLADKAAVFKTKYRDYGFLPLQLIISNDGDQPIALTQIKLELVTVERVKIAPANTEDLYRRMSKLKRRGDEPQKIPLPLPRKKSVGGIEKETAQEIESAQFHAMAVEPHSTQSGFFFFDVADIPNPLAGARLYVSGVRDEKGGELMYFEIALEKYLNYRPGKP